MPKVSIITLSHNYGHFLGDCLRSVSLQTYSDFEHIIIDAGSTDNTVQIAEQYMRFDARTISHPIALYETENWGLCSGRNYAVSKAKGEYIVNLDADDRIRPRFLEKLIEKAGPDKIVCPGMQEFGDRSNSGWPVLPIGYAQLKQANRIFCCSMYPRQAFLDVGEYDVVLDRWGYEDWELWCRLTKAGCKVDVVPELLFEYRVHSESNTAKTWHYDKARIDYIKEKHP